MKGKTRASYRSSVDKEGKKEDAINRSIRKANYGDLLWIQLHGSSWWPAQVVDDSTISAVCKPKKRRKGDVLVRLYGSYKYRFVDPISSYLEFEDILTKYNGSHIAILKESLKQLKLGTPKKKLVKMKENVGADASQKRMVKQKQKKKQKVISKTETKKAPPSGRSSSLEAKSPSKRSKEASLGFVRTKENNSKRRKKEEAQKKSKSNSAKSPRTPSGRASAAATPKISRKRASSLSDNAEQGNNKKKKLSDVPKNLTTDSPNSEVNRPQGSANSHSLSKNRESPRIKEQTQKRVQRKLGTSDAAKTSRANKDAGRKKNAKASKQELIPTATSEEAAKEPSARQVKVMRSLGLMAPAGSPFIRNRSPSSSKKLTT
ncbi:hypothetical protein M9H77_32200 [Catharanthus roseus]|uniref:Uncharacterized protein n=1 Tax=Catharanthus roseus TaxID=4058 RepID=A0ACC0A6G9_CATRO|nr:hypothetical protein M9H77_32200 [Catharanthus roseus]